jgi:hypothetical protein
MWTPELILRRILERERAGLSLETAVVRREAVNLASAAHRHFGSWKQAVLKAHETANGQGRNPTYTRETIIARLQEHAAIGLLMSSKHPMTRLCYKPAVRLFGSWGAAVRAAGFEPLAHSARPRHTKESIITRLREHVATGKTVSRYHPSLKSCRNAAARLFGSWAAALDAAGVKTTNRSYTCERKCWTKEMVIATILEREQHQLSTKHDVVRREAQGLFSAARRLFGSWKAACRAAELSFIEKCGNSREQILGVLQERSRAGKSVSSLHPDMQPYLRTVQRLFGSWTKAREAAGCGRPKSFTKDEVLAALSSIFDNERIPHMRDPDMRPYVPAACRIFGKWCEAVRMAKIRWEERMLRAPPSSQGAYHS